MESYELLGLPSLRSESLVYAEIAKKWTIVAELLEQAGKSGSSTFVDQACLLLDGISQDEKNSMERLSL